MLKVDTGVVNIEKFISTLILLKWGSETHTKQERFLMYWSQNVSRGETTTEQYSLCHFPLGLEMTPFLWEGGGEYMESFSSGRLRR